MKSGNTSNFISYFTGYVMTYPCWGRIWSLLVKGNPCAYKMWYTLTQTGDLVTKGNISWKAFHGDAFFVSNAGQVSRVSTLQKISCGEIGNSTHISKYTIAFLMAKGHLASNTLVHEQNGPHLGGDTFNYIVRKVELCILTQISH